jgi:chloramphenicol 3-O-phosphotransferase
MEKREKNRGDRQLGMSRWQFCQMKNLVWDYDMKIDASQTEPFINAKKILKFLKENEPQVLTKNI